MINVVIVKKLCNISFYVIIAGNNVYAFWTDYSCLEFFCWWRSSGLISNIDCHNLKFVVGPLSLLVVWTNYEDLFLSEYLVENWRQAIPVWSEVVGKIGHRNLYQVLNWLPKRDEASLFYMVLNENVELVPKFNGEHKFVAVWEVQNAQKW